MKIDVKEFTKISNDIFAPIYPAIAKNIIIETGISEGICIDLGTGPGNLGLAMAELCLNLSVILFDLSEEMLEVAEENCIKRALSKRAKVQKGNVEELPFSNNTADLIISRGSIFFWKNPTKAINEAYRVLKPGGVAYIGGGFGNKELLLQIKPKILKQNPNWENERKDRIGENGYNGFKDIMKKSDVKDYEINRKQAGLWIIFKK